MKSVSRQLREALFPIYGRDVERFAILGSIKFCVIFVLTLTRDMKDTIVVTSCGAESIAFLKFYGVLPGSALFFLWYSWLSNRLGREALWNATAFPFFAFFAAFGFIIYPALAQSSLLNDATPSASDRLGALTNATCLLLHWRFALFYVAAELYSSVSISILFWQFANDVVPVDRAPFFYPLFGQVSSLAPIVAGEYVQHFSAKKGADMETNIRRVMGAVSICGLGLVCLQRYYSWRFLSEEENNNMIDVAKVLVAPETLRKATSEEEKERTTKTKKSKKAKMSMIESMRFLLQSEYLGCLAVLVLSYGLSIQFTDIMWKNMVKKLYPSKLEYTLYIATFSSRVGALTFVSIFFGSNIVKRLGWHGGAVTPPAVMCTLSLPFFYLILTGSADLGGSGLEKAVFIGAVQSMFCKAAKNALFDPTTQMAYMPLDEESRIKGKAAIDVIGSRLGKSGGALVQQFLVLGFGSIQAAAPAVAALFYAVIAAWLFAENRLSSLYEAKLEQHHKKIG